MRELSNYDTYMARKIAGELLANCRAIVGHEENPRDWAAFGIRQRALWDKAELHNLRDEVFVLVDPLTRSK